MACVKLVNRSATVAVAPDAPYMAAGTMAGAVDMSFSSSAVLEIFKLDFHSDDHDLPVVGEYQSSERFNRLAWGRNGSGSESYELGLVAGGLVDGRIDVWNPLSLIRSEAGQSPVVANLLSHKGPVRGLEFNSITPNLLASGSDDGEVCIWDLQNPSRPNPLPALKGSGAASQAEISYVSWNSKVPHILASTSLNGITVVWDLKKQKPVISVEDSVRRRCSVLQWHPDVATQLVVASDDDSSPALRLWDMRNIVTPVKEFVGHTKGVIAMSWCPNDSSYLLTCAKDNRTICWNTATGEIVRELPAGTNWNFDVHWYPKIPGIITASSFDGKIGVYNIEGCNRYSPGETDFGVAVKAPKWYKRPAGASFGFGGKLMAFHPMASGASEVYLHSLVTEQTLVSRSSEFEAAIQQGERSSLKALCDKKSQESQLEDERETWGFLKVMFEEDGTARTRMLNHLGFSVPAEDKDIPEEAVSQEINTLRLDDPAPELVNDNSSAVFTADDGEDFFNNLASPKADAPLQNPENGFTQENSENNVAEKQETSGHEESADPLFEDSIQRALVVGDYKGAVAKCISANKIADALVIAHIGGTSLWEKTRDQYLNASHSPYLKVVAAMVNNDLLSLVNSRPLGYWKETLALLCTFAQSDEWSMLCDTLASKLMGAGNTLAATLCYICAGNIDKTVEIWSGSLADQHEGKSYVELLQDLMEKTIVLALASGQKRFSSSLCKLVEKYAEILASQGLFTTAMEYLKLLGSDDLPTELAILRERIALSIEPEEAEAAAFENTQQLNGSVYGSDQSSFPSVDASRQYYPEPAPAQMHQEISSNSYNQNYSQSHGASYGQGYGATASYQPPPQHTMFQPAAPRQMFVPSQSPQVPQANFAPPQSATRTFVPSSGPVLRNPEQFQQPPTLGSQLYPSQGISNPSYHPVQPPAGPQGLSTPLGSSAGPRMPQAVAPSPAAVGFRPVANAGVVQRPGMGPVQPPSNMQPASVAPAATPPPPPPTVQTVDTSNVSAKHRPVIATLTRLFNETSEAMGGARANPARKREIDDNSKKIGALFAKLNSDDISKNASDKLVQLCLALDRNDFSTALHIQVELTTSEWDECNFWLATLKRMIKTRQGAGVRSG